MGTQNSLVCSEKAIKVVHDALCFSEQKLHLGTIFTTTIWHVPRSLSLGYLVQTQPLLSSFSVGILYRWWKEIVVDNLD